MGESSSPNGREHRGVLSEEPYQIKGNIRFIENVGYQPIFLSRNNRSMALHGIRVIPGQEIDLNNPDNIYDRLRGVTSLRGWWIKTRIGETTTVIARE